MKLKQSIFLIFIFLLSVSIYAQTKIFEMENSQFAKISSGYLVYGNNKDVFTLTKYDNDLKKLKEFTKDIKGIKFKAPALKVLGDHYELAFFKKMLGFKGSFISLDTNLSVILEEDFGSDVFGGADSYYWQTEGFLSENRALRNRAFFGNKETFVDLQNKKLVIRTISTGLNKNPITIYSKDILFNDVAIGCNFEFNNGRLFFYFKTKSAAISIGAGRELNIGDLYIGEVDLINNKLKYCSKISQDNFDLSLDKLFYDYELDALVIAGGFLDIEKLKSDKNSEKSEKTGWYIGIIDNIGKVKNLKVYSNSDLIIEGLKERLQTNRATNVQQIIKTSDGFRVLAELDALFYEKSQSSTSAFPGNFKMKQPLGFHNSILNRELDVKMSDFYPIKNYVKSPNIFEPLENANKVNDGIVRTEYFGTCDKNFKSIIYIYNKRIVLLKEGKEYVYIQNILKDDSGNGSNDVNVIQPMFDAYNSKFKEKKSNSTWFFPYSDDKYYIMFWESNKITFELMSY